MSAGIVRLLGIQIAATVVFALLKLSRPSLLATDPPDAIKAVLWSFPNFFEGVIGLFTVSALLLMARHKFGQVLGCVSVATIYATAFVFSAAYVMMQELNVFRFIGGANTVDMMDIYFSLAGLAAGAGILAVLRPHLPAVRGS